LGDFFPLEEHPRPQAPPSPLFPRRLFFFPLQKPPPPPFSSCPCPPKSTLSSSLFSHFFVAVGCSGHVFPSPLRPTPTPQAFLSRAPTGSRNNWTFVPLSSWSVPRCGASRGLLPVFRSFLSQAWYPGVASRRNVTLFLHVFFFPHDPQKDIPPWSYEK